MEDQVTVLFVAPVTTAENCSVAFVFIEVDVGLTVTVTTGTTACTMIVSEELPVPTLFVADMVAVVEPTAVGVPEINPVTVLTEAHDGKPTAS